MTTFMDLAGHRYGRLTVVRLAAREPRVRWLCRCDCGKERTATARDLRNGDANSCGCRSLEPRPRPLQRPPTVTPDGVRISLTRGLIAIIDHEDVDLARFNWSARPIGSAFYAQGRQNNQLVLLHRVIAERAGLDVAGLEVDHKDGDPLNCRRGNLRAATHSQNGCNKGPMRSNKSGIKGVSWNAKDKRWRAQICVNGQRRRLGQFRSKEEAAEAYRAAAAELHGEFSRTE